MKGIYLLILSGLIPYFVFAQGVDYPMQDQMDKLSDNTEDETEFKISLYLEGPFAEGKMDTELNKKDLLPLSQPFNIPPWNYTGTESVDAIPNGNIVDWVLVDVRAADSAAVATSETTLIRKAGFLMSSGSVFNMDGTSLLSMDTLFA